MTILVALTYFIFAARPVWGIALIGAIASARARSIFTAVANHGPILVSLLVLLAFNLINAVIATINQVSLFSTIGLLGATIGSMLIVLSAAANTSRVINGTLGFLLAFTLVVLIDYTLRYSQQTVGVYVSSFRYNLTFLGRVVGPNVFAYTLTLMAIVVFNFTALPHLAKRTLGALCLAGLMLLSARLPVAVFSVFATFFCADRVVRRYWIPAAVLAAVAIYLVNPDIVTSTRLFTLLDGRDTSNATRSSIYSDFQMMFNSPFWGSGVGSYFSTSGFSFHNDFFEIMYSSGSFGFVLYFSSQILLFSHIWKYSNDRRFDFAPLALFSLGFSMTESLSLSLSSFTEIAFFTVLFARTIAITDNREARST